MDKVIASTLSVLSGVMTVLSKFVEVVDMLLVIILALIIMVIRYLWFPILIGVAAVLALIREQGTVFPIKQDAIFDVISVIGSISVSVTLLRYMHRNTTNREGLIGTRNTALCVVIYVLLCMTYDIVIQGIRTIWQSW